jgi:CheY-like chemotaxis protein
VSRTVLVVDDEHDIREIARLALSRIGGYAVLTAADGEEAVRVAVSEHPDAVLLDVMMPVLDGRGALERLRADDSTRAIPVVLLTANAADVAWARELPGVHVLPKPFDPMSLAAEIDAALGW